MGTYLEEEKKLNSDLGKLRQKHFDVTVVGSYRGMAERQLHSTCQHARGSGAQRAFHAAVFPGRQQLPSRSSLPGSILRSHAVQCLL